MEQKKKVSDIYDYEIQKIKDKLSQLENGDINEFKYTNTTTYGSLATNTQQLKIMFDDLMRRIDNDLPSEADRMDEIFK